MSGYDLPSPPGFLASHSGHVTEWSRRAPLGHYVPKTIGHTIFPSSDGAVGTERLDSSEGGKNQLVNFFAFKKNKNPPQPNWPQECSESDSLLSSKKEPYVQSSHYDSKHKVQIT